MRQQIKHLMLSNEIKLIKLPKVRDPRGNLTFIEDNAQIPFKIKRTYWIYDVPGGEERGGHAFTNSNELIVPLLGSFNIQTYSGEAYEEFCLNKPDYGIYIPKLTWRKLSHFVTGSICLVLTDTEYDECSYIYDFNEYIKEWAKKWQR